MTNATVQLRGQQNQADIADKDRRETRRHNKADEKTKAKDAETRASESAWKRKHSAIKLGLDTAQLFNQSKSQKLKDAATVVSMMNEPWFYMKNVESEMDKFIPNAPNLPIGSYDPYAEGAPINVLAATGIQLMNVIPHAERGMDPVNRAAYMLFTRIQQNTNYVKQYQATEVVFMLLAMREVVTLSSHIGKILRSVGIASANNVSLPKAILQAEAVLVNPAFYSGLADYAKRYRSLMLAAQQIKFPDIPIFHRASQIYGSLYYDHEPSESLRPNLYSFNPSGYWKLDYNLEGSIKERMVWTSYKIDGIGTTEASIRYSTIGLNVYLDVLEILIGQLIGDNTIKLIQGDLERSFNCITLDIPDTDVTLLPIYDSNVALQIKNASLPMPSFVLTPAITQDDEGRGEIWSELFYVGGTPDGSELVRCKDYENFGDSVSMTKSNFLAIASDELSHAVRSENGVTVYLHNDTPSGASHMVEATRLKTTIDTNFASERKTDPADKLTLRVLPFGTEVISSVRNIVVSRDTTPEDLTIAEAVGNTSLYTNNYKISEFYVYKTYVTDWIGYHATNSRLNAAFTAVATVQECYSFPRIAVWNTPQDVFLAVTENYNDEARYSDLISNITALPNKLNIIEYDKFRTYRLTDFNDANDLALLSLLGVTSYLK